MVPARPSGEAGKYDGVELSEPLREASPGVVAFVESDDALSWPELQKLEGVALEPVESSGAYLMLDPAEPEPEPEPALMRSPSGPPWAATG